MSVGGNPPTQDPISEGEKSRPGSGPAPGSWSAGPVQGKRVSERVPFGNRPLLLAASGLVVLVLVALAAVQLTKGGADQVAPSVTQPQVSSPPVTSSPAPPVAPLTPESVAAEVAGDVRDASATQITVLYAIVPASAFKPGNGTQYAPLLVFKFPDAPRSFNPWDALRAAHDQNRSDMSDMGLTAVGIAFEGSTLGFVMETSALDQPTQSDLNSFVLKNSDLQLLSTETPLPTPAPSVEEVSPTPVAEAPEPITLQGAGSQASEMFTLEGGLTTFHITASGRSNVIVWLVNDRGNEIELLANTVGTYDGVSGIGVKTGQYLLNVEAPSAWSVTIEQPRPTLGLSPPTNYSGSQPSVIGPLELGGLTRFQMQYSGRSNFIVWLVNSRGQEVDLLANEIGTFSGSVAGGARESIG